MRKNTGFLVNMLKRVAEATEAVVQGITTQTSTRSNISELEQAVQLRRLSICIGAVTASAMVNAVGGGTPKIPPGGVGYVCMALKMIEDAVAAAVTKHKQSRPISVVPTASSSASAALPPGEEEENTKTQKMKKKSKEGEAEKTAAAVVKASQVETILSSVSTALRVMGTAQTLATLLPPLRSLAREHNTPLLQISNAAQTVVEFDHFPAGKTPLAALAVRNFSRGTINSLAARKGYWRQNTVGVASGGEKSEQRDHDGDDNDDDGDDDDEFAQETLMRDEEVSEEELRAAAALKILHAWRLSRERKARGKALLHFRFGSYIFRNWFETVLSRHRELQKAQRDEAAARAVSGGAHQHHQQQYHAQSGGGRMLHWSQAEENVRASADSLFNRYAAVKVSLGMEHPFTNNNTCPICPQQHHHQQRYQSYTTSRGGRVLTPAAPSFSPHSYTDEHTANVAAFLRHCSWYEQKAAPVLAEALFVKTALNFVVDRYQKHASAAKYNITMQDMREPSVRMLLEEIEVTRNWGVSGTEGAASTLLGLQHVCTDSRKFLAMVEKDCCLNWQQQQQQYQQQDVVGGQLPSGGTAEVVDNDNDNNDDDFVDEDDDDDDDGFQMVKSKRKRNRGGKKGKGNRK